MRKILTGAAILALVSSTALADEPIKNPLADGETWADLQYDIVGDAVLNDGSALFDLEAPFRAHDAATVPVKLTQMDGGDSRIEALTIIVDENPAPVVAEFTFGDGMGPLDLETRLRVDQYSNVRAIAVTEGGDTFMTGRYVRASGGCSAPAMKDAAAAMAALGRMKLRQLDNVIPSALSTKTPAAQSGTRRVAQIMIKHPNYSGLQRNQVTQLFIAAHFINEFEVYQGDELLFRMEAGISISEDPSIRFTYTDNGAPTLRVWARDTDGAVFEETFKKTAISM